MREPNLTVMRRSIPLWIGAVLLTALNAFAFSQPASSLTFVALACSAAYALYGIGPWSPVCRYLDRINHKRYPAL